MPLVSKSEAAHIVGVTRQTIHRKIKAGELSATGSEVDTSELIRVFGAISDGTPPVTPMSQPDSAVQTTLQARVDGLESQVAVTREQLADTSKDRDKWREIAKEATSNVKLITNQAAAPKNNDNIAIFIAGAFALGLLTTAIYFMVLRNDVTPSNAMTLPAPMATQDEVPLAETQSAKQKYYYSRDDQIRIDEGLEPLGPFVSGGKFGGIPLSEDDDGVLVALKEVSPLDAAMAEVRAITKKAKDDYQKAVDEPLEQLSEDAGVDFSNLVAVPVEEADQGADVTDSVTPELQAETE
ncbi:hypothetical protein OAS69_06465 [Pseudomonadales bacterium]|nr:hypothetical protein [Pseudomonadales bacterium]